MFKNTKFQIFVLIALALCYLWLFVADPLRTSLLDFGTYLEAATRFRDGQDIYNHTYEIPARDGRIFRLHYFYPPFLAMFLAKFLFLGAYGLQVFWVLLNFAAIIGAYFGLVALASALGAGILPKLTLYITVAFFLLCFEPLYTAVMEGQVNPIILGLLVWFALSVAKEREIQAGTALALAALIKMSPALLLLALLKLRMWRSIAAFAGVSISLTLLLYAFTESAQVYAGFFNPVVPLVSGDMEERFVFNFAVDKSLLSLLGMHDNLYLRWLIKALLFALPLALTLAARPVGMRSNLVLCGILVCCMILAAPSIWFHHMVWLIIPLAVLTIRKEMLDEYSSKAAMRHWTFCLGCYFALSQTNQFHYLALVHAPVLLNVTALLPALVILIVIAGLAQRANIRLALTG